MWAELFIVLTTEMEELFIPMSSAVSNHSSPLLASSSHSQHYEESVTVGEKQLMADPCWPSLALHGETQPPIHIKGEISYRGKT